jgi:hypothetical protein
MKNLRSEKCSLGFALKERMWFASYCDHVNPVT